MSSKKLLWWHQIPYDTNIIFNVPLSSKEDCAMHRHLSHSPSCKDLGPISFIKYEAPLVCVTNPTYFRVHHVFEQGITFLEPIRAVEIGPWTFTFGNAWEVHHEEHKHLCETMFWNALCYRAKHYVSPINQSRWNPSLDHQIWLCMRKNALWKHRHTYAQLPLNMMSLFPINALPLIHYQLIPFPCLPFPFATSLPLLPC